MVATFCWKKTTHFSNTLMSTELWGQRRLAVNSYYMICLYFELEIHSLCWILLLNKCHIICMFHSNAHDWMTVRECCRQDPEKSIRVVVRFSGWVAQEKIVHISISFVCVHWKKCSAHRKSRTIISRLLLTNISSLIFVEMFVIFFNKRWT